MSYEERLRKMCMLSLARRTLRYYLTAAHDVLERQSLTLFHSDWTEGEHLSALCCSSTCLLSCLLDRPWVCVTASSLALSPHQASWMDMRSGSSHHLVGGSYWALFRSCEAVLEGVGVWGHYLCCGSPQLLDCPTLGSTFFPCPLLLLDVSWRSVFKARIDQLYYVLGPSLQHKE